MHTQNTLCHCVAIDWVYIYLGCCFIPSGHGKLPGHHLAYTSLIRVLAEIRTFGLVLPRHSPSKTGQTITRSDCFTTQSGGQTAGAHRRARWSPGHLQWFFSTPNRPPGRPGRGMVPPKDHGAYLPSTGEKHTVEHDVNATVSGWV